MSSRTKLDVGIFESYREGRVIGHLQGPRLQMGSSRRWGFHGLPATHGQSDRERAPGSLGRQHSISQASIRQEDGRTLGRRTVTSRNLDVVKVRKDKKLIFVQGAVRTTGGLVLVKESTWTAPKPSTVVSKKAKAPANKK